MSAPSISPTQSETQAALLAFLTAVLPAGTPILSGQQNRTPEPTVTTFVIMTPVRFTRLETNLDDYADVKFIGAISGTTLTVSLVNYGVIAAGAALFGVGVAGNTTIIQQTSGTPGGAGTYTITPSQTVTSIVLSAGGQTITQGAQVDVQLDFHSADTTAGDLAQTVSTLFRDEYGVDFFAGLASPLNSIVPLYADDPRQVPFINAEQQYEWRWVLEARLQVNQVVSVPQQFADTANVVAISVEATYPPG